MNKFIYAVSNSKQGTNLIQHIYARHLEDAKDRILQTYFDKYVDIEEDENWKKFVNELWKKHGVLISDPIEIEELLD